MSSFDFHETIDAGHGRIEIGDEKTIERRYFISSLDMMLKNSVMPSENTGELKIVYTGYWTLFLGKKSRVRKDFAPENMAMLRHICFESS